jgi:phosphatidylethanolamine/phosphatidyl-N-methylethanolamine N-methyltransferase
VTNQPSDSSNFSEKLNSDPSEYFSEAYQDVMYKGVVGTYSRLVHKLMERPYRGMDTPRILEVGSGFGQHAEFVASDFVEYIQSDFDPVLVARQHPDDPRVIPTVANAEDLSQFPDQSFDRVIATCLLAHLDNPERALGEWHRVLKPGGSLCVYVPAEPGILLRFLRHVVVAPKSKKLGQDHLSIVYRDHRNHLPGMRYMIKHAFRGDKLRKKRFPTGLVGWNLALFDVYFVTKR